MRAVVEEEPVGEDEPALLVPLDVVCPLVEPSLNRANMTMNSYSNSVISRLDVQYHQID